MLHEKSGTHQSQYDSSSGDRECLYGLNVFTRDKTIHGRCRGLMDNLRAQIYSHN